MIDKFNELVIISTEEISSMEEEKWRNYSYSAIME
jgi:hypothetical protein